MSEIKTILNFFDKDNGLKTVLKDLKSIKKLQVEINNQKGGVGSENLKERTAALKEIARLQKELNAQRKKSLKTGKEAVGIEKELVKVQEQDRKVKKQLKVARTEKFRQLQESKLAQRKQNQAIKAEIIENSKLSSEYERQSAKLNRLRKNLKNLILTEGEGSAKTKKLAAEVGKLDQKLKGADAAAGQFQRNVGNYPKGLKGAIGALKNFAGALGITAGIAGLVRGIGAAINIFKDFEKANSNLRAVLNGTDEEMKALSDSAKELGSTTAFTASEVTELNIALAKLGFPTSDILQMNEAILSGAAAMDSDLGETATLVGATLRSFGLDASETGRVVDVLSKSTSASALDFAKLNASMSTIAPVANKFGFSLEGTTALLGQLSNAGFDASSAATATRNILLNLADSNGKLAKSLKEPVKDLPSLVKGLEQLKSEGVDLGAALELTDKRSVAAFATFLGGTDDVLALNDALEKAKGTAKEMEETQLDNLSGSITILSSAWEGFILSLEDGSNSFGRILRAIVDVSTELLSLLGGFAKAKKELNETQLAARELAESIIKVGKVIGILITSFIAYKVGIIATNVAVKAFSLVTKGATIAQNLQTIATKAATTAMKVFNKVTKLNPLGVLLGVVTAMVGALYLFRDGTDEATEGNSLLLSSEEDLETQLEATNKKLETRVSLLDRMSVDNAKSTLSLKELKDELTAAENQLENLNIAAAKQLKTEQLAKAFEVFDEVKEGQEKVIQTAKDFETATKSAVDVESQLQESLNTEIEILKKLIAEKEAAIKGTDKQTKSTKKLTQAEKDAIALAKLKLQAKINEQKERDEILNAIEKSENDFFESQLKKEEQEIRKVEEHYFLLLTKADEFGFDSTQLEEDRQAKLDAIRKKWRDKEIEDNKKLMAELEKQAAEEIAKDKAAKDKAAKEAEEVAAAKKEQQQEVIAQSKEAVDFALDELTRESEAKIEALDRQINAEQDFLSQNENLSAREIEFRRKKAAELEAERIKEQQRLERLAKTQAFFDLVAAFASSGDGQGAVGKAASAMLAAEAISGGFHDGGYTGDGNEYDSAGVVHKGEMVQTKAQTSEYGMKGWKAKDFDNAISDGYFNQFADSGMFADQNAKFLSVQSNEVGYDFKNLENRLDSVVDAVSNIQSSDFAIQDGYFIKTKKSKGSTLITKKKLG